MPWPAGSASAARLNEKGLPVSPTLMVRCLLAGAVLLGPPPAMAATPAPAAATAPTGERDDYANHAFTAELDAGMRAFYQRDFPGARAHFDTALKVIPDNSLAISFMNAAASHQPGELDALINNEEDDLAKNPKSYLAHVRLGFSYLLSGSVGRNRDIDAREELNAAVIADPDAVAAHVGLGIMRANERSANRAKVEFLAALDKDKRNVLAREYLASLYQNDLKDPQRALVYIVDIPNYVPNYADIDYHIASLLTDLNSPSEAVKYATRGLEIDVGHVGEAGQFGYTLLAQIYLTDKKYDDARRVLKAAIASNSNADYAGTLMQKLDNGDYGAPAKPSPAPKKKQ